MLCIFPGMFPGASPRSRCPLGKCPWPRRSSTICLGESQDIMDQRVRIGTSSTLRIIAFIALFILFTLWFYLFTLSFLVHFILSLCCPICRNLGSSTPHVFSQSHTWCWLEPLLSVACTVRACHLADLQLNWWPCIVMYLMPRTRIQSYVRAAAR